MESTAGQPRKGADGEGGSRRRALPLAIVAIATLIGFLSVAGLWVKRQALETETFANTSAELLQREEIRVAVADFVVNTIYENVDVEAEIAGRLPPEAQALAAPAAAGLRRLANEVTLEALSRPEVQDIWEQATAAAQSRLIALLDDEGEFVSTTGGVVTLDLAGLIDEAAAEIGIGGNVSSRLPPEASQIPILESEQLSAAQSGIRILRTLAWALTALTLLLYALAIWLATGRRRETLRAVGYSFAFIGLLVLFIRGVAANAVTDSLASSPSSEPAVDATWEVSTSLLLETAQSLIAYGVVIVFAAWLAGPTALATSVRHGITPYLRRPLHAYTAVAVLYVLLLLWDPVIATSRLAPSLVLAVLLVIGVEALRRQVIAEFPDHVEARSPAELGSALLERARERRAGPRASAGESRIEQLERLARLRESGLLDEGELEAEKRRILGTG